MASHFHMPNAFDPQMAMMAMAAAAGGSAPGMLGSLGTGIHAPPMGPPPPGADSQAHFTQSVDPAMAQAYAAMFTHYLQQSSQQPYADTSMGLGVPPPSFPISAPYAPPVPASPVISVHVDGMKFQYQLTEDDLQKVFSRYGTVKLIAVDPDGTSANITFYEYSHAQAAMSDLNGKVLNGLDGTLRLAWATVSQPAPPPPPYHMMPTMPNWGYPSTPGLPPWPPSMPPSAAGMPADFTSMLNLKTPMMQPGAIPGTPGAVTATSGIGPAAAHVKGVRKYTCRFLIGIENDKDFQVVRRIIGAKGINMKRIVKQTEAKLRLRGIGSGYFEGAGHRESNEPLQLCVSCTSSDGYRTAVKLVEELLDNVYSEFRQFCRDAGKPELDLRPVAQLVSSGGRGAGGGGGRGPAAVGYFGGGGNAASGGEGSDDEDDDDDYGEAEGDGTPEKKDGRRARGRRPRSTKSEAEKGEPPAKAPPLEEIEKMIDARNEARRQCNFSEADRIREALHERGVALMDEPGARGKGAEVTTWRYWRD